jgi:hypothetical protein
MDWRLIAAISGAAGTFCFVAIGAYVVFAHDPTPRRSAAAAPTLLSEYRFAVTTTPSLMSVRPATPSPFEPDPSAQSPFAPQGSAAHSSYPPPLNAQGKALTTAAAVPSGRIDTPAPAVNAVRQVPHGVGPPPVVEVKKSSVVPELHAALPTSRYRGVLTSAEIVRVRSSLRLTPEQERAWPPVEAALAEMGRQQIALIRRGQEPRIAPSEWPPGRLYAVAGPLLQTLRPDQKEVVRRLCRSLGFENVASMI